MNSTNNCLICCRPLDSTDDRYHPQCSQRLFNQRTAPALPYGYDDLKEAAKKIVRSRITVPGVQAKLSLNLEKSRKKNSRFTLVGLWGNFILKPPVEIYPNMPQIEHMTMQLANLFKIDTVRHGLIHMKSGELAYITRSIDRTPGGEKLHMEDMCQLTERLTEDKYHGSMEQIGKILKRYSSNPLLDCIRFFDVALFSFLTGNADMHLKNFSLIYPVDGMVQLSAAYDMLATRLLISEKDDPEEMALTINGKKRKLTLDDFHQLAVNLGMNQKQTKNVYQRFSKVLPATRAAIERGFIPDDKASEFKQLVTDRAARLKLL
jgi:serine/threonine-protein kinase HipA